MELLATIGSAVRRGPYTSWYFPAWWRDEREHKRYMVYEMEPEARLQLAMTLTSAGSLAEDAAGDLAGAA